jgi:hypothetical protein
LVEGIDIESVVIIAVVIVLATGIPATMIGAGAAFGLDRRQTA